MNLRRLCAALAFTLLPAILPAQPAPVQSGEHANFTRIVVTLPPEADWKVTQQGQSVVLQVANYTKGFETSGIFRRIPQDRISGVEAEAGSLILTLACDCRAAVFEEQNRHVVIDVALADVRLPVAFIPLGKAPAGILPALPKIPRPLPQRVARLTTEDMVNSLGRTPLTPEAQVALDEMQQRLAEEIAAATSRGLLEVAVPPIALPPEKDAVPTTAETAANPLPDLFNNLRVSSSMDLPTGMQPGQRPSSPDGITCTPDADVALSQWGDDRPAALQISKARSTLWQDDGTLNAEAALTLARLYLHLGFGVEAADLLEQIPEASQPLIALAQIMEHEPSANLPALSRQRYCRGDISLWAILATPLPVPPPRIDPGPPLLALNKLPLHLRRMVAPALSERFVSNGNPNAAAAALRSIERAKKPDDLPAAARLARADLALNSGQTDEGTAELAALSAEGSPEAPAALIALIDARLTADQPIDPETAKLVATYAYELRKSPLGAELRRAHVLALLKSGAFDAAFDAARQLGAEVEAETAVSLRLRLIAELGQNASDIVFLDHILRQDMRDIARLPRRDQLHLIDRLLTLGFAENAQEYLRTVPEKPRQADRQLLAARVALALNQPMLARASLIEIPGDAAQELRAQAQLAAGNPAEAYRLYQDGPPPRDLQRITWLAEQTLQQGLETDPVFGPILSLSQQETSPPEPGNGMLSGSDALITASAGARDILQTFLQSPELAIAADETR